jgi:tRNA(Ile)-lysidine synthase
VQDFKEKVSTYIGAHSLLAPGDRVAVAVSGGADSVALLRILLELRRELGIVLSVAHFNHKIRGVDSDADERFVAELAKLHGLELHTGYGDTPAYARQSKQGLEAAARQLRYNFFRGLFESQRISRIATGHTLDDQAETVLMRLIRGAGTKGLAGIYPVHRDGSGQAIIRPLLNLRHYEIEAYLRRLGQPWREDASNSDRQHLRNRIRHELLPLLESEFNPSMTRVLAEMAEIARAEEDYWREMVAKSLPEWVAEGAGFIPVEGLRSLPVALQRRGLRGLAEKAGVTLDFEHVEEVRRLALSKPTLKPKKTALPHAQAELVLACGSGELRLHRRSPSKNRYHGDGTATAYEYRLAAPGEVQIVETGSLIRARMVPATALAEAAGEVEGKRYNPAQLFDPGRLAAELTVRNWRAGDRYWPARGKSPRKVKELLQRVPRAQRELWPVVLSGREIVWMRGFPPSSRFILPAAAEGPRNKALVIEELRPSAEPPPILR